jgi:DNA-binding transcriptional MerR regulator
MIKRAHSKAKYYYTIGEVCAITELKPSVLRFWETQFPELRPRRRKSGNRRYTPYDIETIKKIKYLLYEKGYTIKGAKKRLKTNEFPQEVLFKPTEKDEYYVKALLEIKEQLQKLKDDTKKLKDGLKERKI